MHHVQRLLLRAGTWHPNNLVQVVGVSEFGHGLAIGRCGRQVAQGVALLNTLGLGARDSSTRQMETNTFFW